ncbi:DNA translocase FtsK 4TM domain-containing protein [Alphaproteobacteria bacterium]|nr:DNA translocase FtsK 4TM domain-containing protein [Alphaproteobacteria bacterium]
MNETQNDMLESKLLDKVVKNSMFMLLFSLSITIFLSLVTFNPDDQGWGVVSVNESTNFFGETGAWVSGLIIREFGFLTGLLFVSVLFIWSLKFFNSSTINFIKFKTLSLLLMIIAGSFGDAYLEILTSEFISSQIFTIFQEGYSDWIFIFVSENVSNLFGTDSLSSSHILGISSLSISLAMFVWISSLGPAEINFFKFILGPVIKPLIWLTTMLYNLFFVVQKNNEKEIVSNKVFNLISNFKNKFLKQDDISIQRKIPKIRKNNISINNKINSDEKVLRNKKSSLQDDLPLGSENGFVLPSIKLLKILTEDIKPPSKETLDLNAKVLEGVLSDYSINGNIDSVRYGPVVTRYDLEPAPGLRSQRVISLADDIARSMSVEAVRVAMVPGQNVIGIELPNKDRETVILRNILEHEEFKSSAFSLPVCLGKNIAGFPIVVDLAKMPHLLVAGTTGSGKSVGINAMILSLLYKHTPETCRMIMIDPKMLELSVYDGIPHLLTPVVTDPKKAVVALKWAVREMETRYMSMSKLGVRNIDSYNERLIEARRKGEVLSKSTQVGFDPETGQPIFEDQQISLTPLPFIVVVIDEVADLMLVAGKDIEAAVQRLAQMARAAGIHVVMATQRPSVDVITGTIKANFPTRISFQVTSKIDSRTILGEQGAEQLLGRGDMLYMAGGGKVTRVHGPFVEDTEVEKVAKFLSNQSVPEYDETITEEPENSNNFDINSFKSSNNQHDELYDQAVALIAREGRASTSFIQRHFKIGYNRAATIIEKMEENNVVSKPGRAGKREVLIEDR